MPAFDLLNLTILAAVPESAFGDGVALLIRHVCAAVVFSIMGLVVFGIGIWLCNKLAPFSLRKEIEEDQNTAVAIIVGALIIGIAIIIAAATQG